MNTISITLFPKKVDLTKNTSINRQGLQSLLNSNSRVDNNYTYLLSTANLSYRILWIFKQTPTQLEINNIEIRRGNSFKCYYP
ncbi:hypothetical protein [Geminocystis sp. NIES-3708]|uniref:hypothetical protein n=1 Tax=Geminocystis sp. NIES-3708 TaxID=1615909 RepID=UPI0011876039|nr:hypothetical protein [Geminocystis sp. NIES-3708]